MPTEFLAVQGDAGVESVITQARDDESRLNARTTPEGQVVIPDEQRDYLAGGGPAAQQLLETLNRGLEATTPKLEAASVDRLFRAGLL